MLRGRSIQFSIRELCPVSNVEQIPDPLLHLEMHVSARRFRGLTTLPQHPAYIGNVTLRSWISTTRH